MRPLGTYRLHTRTPPHVAPIARASASVVPRGLPVEADLDVVEADPRRDRHAVPLVVPDSARRRSRVRRTACVGNCASVHLVSCIASTSTSARASQSVTRSTRERIELTFQVASRTRLDPSRRRSASGGGRRSPSTRTSVIAAALSASTCDVGAGRAAVDAPGQQRRAHRAAEAAADAPPRRRARPTDPAHRVPSGAIVTAPRPTAPPRDGREAPPRRRRPRSARRPVRRAHSSANHCVIGRDASVTSAGSRAPGGQFPCHHQVLAVDGRACGQPEQPVGRRRATARTPRSAYQSMMARQIVSRREAQAEQRNSRAVYCRGRTAAASRPSHSLLDARATPAPRRARDCGCREVRTGAVGQRA